MSKKQALGKGLGAIFSDLGETSRGQEQASYITCGIEELCPNRFQPRKTFNREELDGLIASIREKGVIQPILVRPIESGYEIIAGERRWRAAQAAGLGEVPIIIRSAEDIESAEISLIENIQREELNAIEEANAYRLLIDAFDLSQEDVSRRVGKDRSTITNSLRLLKLPEAAKEALVSKQISSGHARCLLSLSSEDDQINALRHIISKGISVRETERYIKRMASPSMVHRVDHKKDDSIVDLEETLSKHFMTRVTVKQTSKGGSVELFFTSTEDLIRLSDILLGRISRSE